MGKVIEQIANLAKSFLPKAQRSAAKYKETGLFDAAREMFEAVFVDTISAQVDSLSPSLPPSASPSDSL